MKITLNADLFQTDAFQASFKEKLRSTRHYDHSHLNSFTGVDLKHYQYARAAKGALAEAGVYGYLVLNDIDFVYSKKADKRRHSPVDFYIPSINARIDVKSGFSYWKKLSLLKYSIDYVVVSVPMLEHKQGIYRKNGWMMLESYRRLFKDNITVDISGYISTNDILNKDSAYELQSIDKLF